MGTTTVSSTRPRQHVLRRLLLVLLDTRGKWWLSLWLWLPAAGFIGEPAMSWRMDFGGYQSTSDASIIVGVREDGQITSRLSGNAIAHWRVHLRSEQTISALRWTVTFETTAEPLWDKAAGEPPRPDPGEIGLLGVGHLQHRLDYHRMPGIVEEDAQEWLDEALSEITRHGMTVRSRLPTLRVLTAYVGLTIVQYGCMAGLLLSLLAWFVRGAQIGHYRRMLRRHEAGRCPHCDYDISAAPDCPCPECGCDHRARRREAVRALEEANRRVR